MTADSSAPVSSHDEWSPLREVVVGTPYHLDYHEDASFRLFFHQNLPRAGEGPGTRAAANRLPVVGSRRCRKLASYTGAFDERTQRS